MLVGITGSLGKGKTLTLAYLAWNNYFFFGRKIYSNITLYGIPFTKITTVKGLEYIIPLDFDTKKILSGEEYTFIADELWRWVSSRMIGKGQKVKQDLINRILLASRKAFVTIIYTAQSSSQIDKWIKEITDIWIYPLLTNQTLTTFWLSEPVNNPTYEKLMRASIKDPVTIRAVPFFALYNTYERVKMIDEEEDTLEEEYHDIKENIAFKKYCIDNGMSEEQYLKFCEKIKKEFWLDIAYKNYINSKTKI